MWAWMGRHGYAKDYVWTETLGMVDFWTWIPDPGVTSQGWNPRDWDQGPRENIKQIAFIVPLPGKDMQQNITN